MFDKVGNLTRRQDVLAGRDETFLYDTLNRVTSISLTQGASAPTTTTVSYDAYGNITQRSDVGSYYYGATAGCGAGPHAVKTIIGSKNASYCYDLNGDMVSGDGRPHLIAPATPLRGAGRRRERHVVRVRDAGIDRQGRRQRRV